MILGLNLPTLRQGISHTPRYRQAGKLRSATGMLTCALPAAVGDHCEIMASDRTILAEVIGFEKDHAFIPVPFDPADDLRAGMTVVRKGRGMTVPTGRGLLGRVIDGLGRPMDGKGPLVGGNYIPSTDRHPRPDRARIRKRLVTGQCAIDSLLTWGADMRVGIFAEAASARAHFWVKLPKARNPMSTSLP